MLLSKLYVDKILIKIMVNVVMRHYYKLLKMLKFAGFHDFWPITVLYLKIFYIFYASINFNI